MPRESVMEIKTVNRNRIYRMIYQNPRISRPELCHRLGLSMPTVMQNVRYLQDRGWWRRAAASIPREDARRSRSPA